MQCNEMILQQKASKHFAAKDYPLFWAFFFLKSSDRSNNGYRTKVQLTVSLVNTRVQLRHVSTRAVDQLDNVMLGNSIQKYVLILMNSSNTE